MTDSERQRALWAQAQADLAPLQAAMRQPFTTVTPTGPGAADLQQFYGMLRYHLGWADEHFAAADLPGGKRLRPLLLLRCAVACGATPEAAAPAAAAIELLHNFTLVHDDVQDESAYRHHRETIWRRWGAATAINVGDALYALAHEAFYRLVEPPASLPATQVVALARAFDQMALRIVEGQHLDLAHEGEWSGGEDRYLAMIAGKTAAILAFAAQAGAQIAGAAPAVVAACGEFGLSLGLAFQIHDDWLGIWGEQAVTGKPTADDIRRRKQSLPIVALDERANAVDRATLHELYAAPAPLADAAVATIMALLAEYNIDAYCQQRAADYHDQTRLALTRLAAQGIDTSGLQDYLDLLVQRTH